MRRRPQWWLRLGGPNAMNLPAWILTFIGGTAAAFTWIPRGVSVRWSEWVTLSAMAQLMVGGVLLVAWFTYLSPRLRASRPTAVLVTLFAAGALRGAFLSEMGQRAGLVDESYVVERALGAAISFTVWYSMFTLMVDGWRRHRITMQELTKAALHEKSLAEREASLVREFRVDIIERTEAAIAAELEAAMAAASRPTTVAATLQRTVDDIIRPLSHEMCERTLQDEALLQDADKYLVRPRFPGRAYLVGTVSDRPFAPILTALICLVTAPIVTVRILGAGVGALVLVVTTASVGLGLAAVRRPVAPRLQQWPFPRRAIIVVTCWLAVVAATGLILLGLFVAFGVQPDSWLSNTAATGPQLTIASILALALTSMVVAAVEGSISATQRRAEQDLRLAASTAEWAKARLRQRAASERMRFGQVLHGGVQARVLAAALLIDRQAPDDAVETITGLAHSIHNALAMQPETPWRQELSDLSEVWGLAIDLTFNVTPEAELALDQDPLAARSLVIVIGEAITNAVRHGDANAVDVGVKAEPNYLDVTATDDGSAHSGPAEAGMGTRVYNTHFAEWTLTWRPQTTVRGRIPCDSRHPAAMTIS